MALVDGGFGESAFVALIQLFVLPFSAIVLLLVGLVTRQRRIRAIGVRLLLAVVSAFVVSGVVQRTQVRASQARGDELCEALEHYRGVEGEFPENLQELVPRYATEVPSTAMGVFRSKPYWYQRDSSSGDDFSLGFDSLHMMFCRRGRDGPWQCDD